MATRATPFHRARLRFKSRQDIFSGVYESTAWGSDESGSGTGSELRATANIREELPRLLTKLGAETLLDAPCGDWNWLSQIELPVSHYFGIDIVPQVIAANNAKYASAARTFTVGDLVEDSLPRADVVLCRDCLVHVSFQDARAILDNFRRSGATWVLINTYPEVTSNHNQLTGPEWRRLNFHLPPFNFPEPVETIADGGQVDPSQLALWRLADLPQFGS
ncbi:class I SAM-dependent methyltransferase [Antrihabitans cavernicola]|uniref:Class I SAM-dependent methyltransferase n=1 Tax=Antrihabitans cavernicola TaxID=2495913 RepID=A0A5A7SI03_9NOCA|nr:class I SAM-dependent methyltransferase [Spelaeibacter cavernicola]KAA0023851.1 class I SAM-dependent methyltransferase [Spelaeibacter cavernicola]